MRLTYGLSNADRAADMRSARPKLLAISAGSPVYCTASTCLEFNREIALVLLLGREDFFTCHHKLSFFMQK